MAHPLISSIPSLPHVNQHSRSSSSRPTTFLSTLKGSKYFMHDLKEKTPRASTMQHLPSRPPCRRPKRSRRALVLRRRRLPKRRSLFQLLKRGGTGSGNGRQKATQVVGDDDGKEEMEMEMVNMKLYLENRCIMEENRRLRKKALALRHENQLLLTQLHHHPHLKSAVIVDNNDNRNDGSNSSGAADEHSPVAHHHHHHHHQPQQHGQPGSPSNA